MIVSAGSANLIVLLDRLEFSVAAATLRGNLAKDLNFEAFAPELASAGEHLRGVLSETAYAAGQHGPAMCPEDAVAFAEEQVRRALAERAESNRQPRF